MSVRPCGNKTAASVLPVLGHVLSRCGIIDRVMAVAVVCLGVTLAAWANPSAPEFGGTWDASGTAAENFTQQTAILKINDGIAVTVTNTTIAVTGSFESWYDHTEAGTLINYGTIDLTSWSGTRLWQVPAGKVLTITNFGSFVYDDLGEVQLYNLSGAANFHNAGTLAKTAGTGSTIFDSAPSGTHRFFNYCVDGSGATNGGTIRVDAGTYNIGGGHWFFEGTQAIDVAQGAVFVAADSTVHWFGGTWVGTGDGVVKWAGASDIQITNSVFTLNIDNGDRSSYTNGGVQLGGANFRGTVDTDPETVLNKGKFWFTATERWQDDGDAAGGLNLHNEGWLVWDPGAAFTAGWAYDCELVNKAGGVMDVIGVVGDGTASGSGSRADYTLKTGSTLRRRVSSGTVNWNNNDFTIEDGATVEVHAGELEIRAVNVYFGPATTPTSDLKFNVAISNGCILDIDDIPAAGITTVGGGATLSMNGTAAFVDDAANVLESKLTTVNGTLFFGEGFSLTPGGGTLTVNSSGTIGGTGTVNGALSCAGTNRVAISGATGDRLTVNGTLDLTGATLTLSVGIDPTEAEYVIIANDGADAVTGTFSGLVEGSLVAVGARNYAITYVGGTGNDVVLRLPSASGTVISFR